MLEKRVPVLLWFSGVVAFFGAMAVAVGQDQPALQTVPMLRYQFEAGQKNAYEFEASATIDDSTIQSAGFVTYQLKSANPSEDLDGNSLGQHESGEATSTAFVITSDGYLVTCAHCVEGAEQLDLEVGGKKYAAEIIHSDPAFDLAILKIDATDLPYVRLGDSKSVQLAQDVRGRIPAQ